MDHLEILKEAARTVSSPRRWAKGKWVTDRGACSIGHLVVASQGGVTSVIGSGVSSSLARDTKGHPELAKAVNYIAQAMSDDVSRKNGTLKIEEGIDMVDVVASYNDASTTSHEDVKRSFAEAIRRAEADLPKPEPVPTLDFTEIDSLLDESARYEGDRELVAA